MCWFEYWHYYSARRKPIATLMSSHDKHMLIRAVVMQDIVFLMFSYMLLSTIFFDCWIKLKFC